MVKRFAGPSGRRARQRARKGIRLLEVGVTPSTHSRYFTAVRKVLPLVEKCTSMDQLDDAIGDWIETVFAKGEPLNSVAGCLSGIHHFIPSTKRHLPLSWRLFGIWRRHEVPARAPPLTSDIVFAMASWAIQGLDLSFAGLILLGFHCFLRTGELLSLTANSLLLREGSGIVTLHVSKGGSRRRVQESVTIDDPTVYLVLEELVALRKQQRQSHLPLWNASGSSFRKKFDDCLQHLMVGDLRFRPYSLRRGGATAFMQQTGSLERTLLKGRWSSISVARIYLCDALAQLPKLTCSLATKARLAHYNQFWPPC